MTDQGRGRGEIGGHQPVLQILALTRFLRRLGLEDSKNGLGLLHAQLILLFWRHPELPLDRLRQRFYLDARTLAAALAHLQRRAYLKSADRTRAGKKPRPLLQRRWQLTARARKIAPALLRAEEKFNRALCEHGVSFSAHWCYDMQNINSALHRQAISAGKRNTNGDTTDDLM